jgi:Prokaryotic E2 family E
MLPEEDQRYLDANHPGHTVQVDAGMICIVLPGFPLPAGYSTGQADLLLTFSNGYPDSIPDMWWFDPPAVRADGQVIPATDQVGSFLGRAWQRWSRHLSADQWQSGVDNVQSYVALIRSETLRAVSEAA